MNKSQTFNKLAAALTKAQAEMPVVKMNAVNPFLKNKYADLGAVINASRAVLGKYGLAIIQTPVSIEDKIGITTMLIHESGEWLEDTITINVPDGKGLSSAQNTGVVISYLRRYSWASILGLYTDEDTDGHTPPVAAKKQADGNGHDKRTWTVAQKSALIEAQLADNDFAAKGMLGLSGLPEDATVETIVRWGAIYRENRGTKDAQKLSATDAAEVANKTILEVAK